MAAEEERPDYPAHWEADVVLRDGGAARLRPIRAADADLLVEFYARVSPESKYLRFFAPYPELSARDVERFTQVDYRGRNAFVLTIGREIVAVGRYDTVAEPPGHAEVAFLVEDRHQGRGIGQLLLEHLAQAARERGIAGFVAEVLPDNRRMIQTFRDAGYQSVRGVEDGVIHLEFPIDRHRHRDGRDGLARAPLRGRARSERFFVADSVAVIGASPAQDTIGRTLVRNLVIGDYSGRVYVVNPSADAVAGMPAYQTVQAIPDRVDLAIVAVPADAVQDVVLDCAAKGVHGLIVISSGFAETRRGGPQAAAPAGRAGPLLRPAADRSQLPRHHQHRPGDVAERLACRR